jgi:hypothetical protein
MRSPTPIRTVALVACSKQKLDRQARARDLYTSPLFQKSLSYAGRIATPGYVFILSAKHGLVRPDQELEPYDLTLSEFEDWELADWAHVIGIQLEDALDFDPLQGANQWHRHRVVLLASELYLPQLPEIAAVERPLGRMQIGERLSWLNAQIGQRVAA